MLKREFDSALFSFQKSKKLFAEGPNKILEKKIENAKKMIHKVKSEIQHEENNKNSPVYTTVKPDGVVDGDASPFDQYSTIELGFVIDEEKIRSDWKIWDDGKVGGKPKFLVPLHNFVYPNCNHCGNDA